MEDLPDVRRREQELKASDSLGLTFSYESQCLSAHSAQLSLNHTLESSHRVALTWYGVLIVILKPSEKAVHSGEDLAPVPESFWSHSYIFYPGILEGNMHQIPLVTSWERVARADLHHVK